MNAIKEEKTTLEWFNTLKEPYRQQAINNSLKQNRHPMDKKWESLVQAINKHIDWSSTPEKHDYWYSINRNTNDYIEKEVSYEIY